MAVNLRALLGKLNPTTRAALEAAAGLCLSRTHYSIEPEHYLLKLLDEPNNDVSLICARFSVVRSGFTAELSRSLDRLKSGNSRTPSISPLVVSVLREAWCIASLDFNADQIRGAHIALAMLNGIPGFEMAGELRKIDVAELSRQLHDIVAKSSETAAAPTEQAVEPTTRGGPARVFISYRRGDGDDCADRLYDRLLATVPGVKVFRDLDTLRLGDDFANRIETTIKSCDVLIAIVGNQWLAVAQPDGHRRIDNERDYVRMEIAAALKAEKRVIPVLLEQATMPVAADLPSEIAPLVSRHGLHISMERFRYDTEELVRELAALANSIRP